MSTGNGRQGGGWLSRFTATHGAIAAAVALVALGAGGTRAVSGWDRRIEQHESRIRRLEQEQATTRARMEALEATADTIRSTTEATRALADRILCYLEADRGRRPMADCIRGRP